ncbi:MAG: hypothetical protein L0Y71_19475 [Gemmataceae bacterium]|nr:hypothetical protein [Gemmataceae bacterium]
MALWPDQGGQGGLVLIFWIECGQPFGSGGTEKALIGSNQDQVIAGGS